MRPLLISAVVLIILFFFCGIYARMDEKKSRQSEPAKPDPVLIEAVEGDSVPTIEPLMVSALNEAMFRVEHADIVVIISDPIFDNSSTENLIVISGRLPIVAIPDWAELVGAPQSHWDGINEKTRWAYTICYRKKGKDAIDALSFNLSDFIASSMKDGRVSFARMGIVSNSAALRFVSMAYDDMSSSKAKNPKDFIVQTP